MTEVLHSSPSPSSSSSFSSTHNDTLFSAQSFVEEEEKEGGSGVTDGDRKERDKDKEQLSLLALLLTLLRRSFSAACKTDRENLSGMEISWPSNVRHVAHVTFDRFNGFLGLPVEFEPEVSRRAPSASTTVFGVSTNSMQLSYDSRGNSVPTILLLMQRCLYAHGGLQAEGIFRINAENSQEEYVRDQLNSGEVPEGIDVHCLAGLIKAWFRELPAGVLDTLSPEQVMQCQSEDDCTSLVRLLPPAEGALLDWAINLMADVVQHEHLNKMNARNIAMVFAPNMTQMADPLTALMYAVQVMNFLKTLIEKTLREREDFMVDSSCSPRVGPSDEDGHQNLSWVDKEDNDRATQETEPTFVAQTSSFDTASDSIQDEEYLSYYTSTDESEGGETCESPTHASVTNAPTTQIDENTDGSSLGQPSDFDMKMGPEKIKKHQNLVTCFGYDDKSKGISNLSRIDPRTERIEAWR